MLISVSRALVKNPIKESFNITLWEMKKTVKILIVYFSFPIKIFFNWILNQCPKGTR